MALKDQKK